MTSSVISILGQEQQLEIESSKTTTMNIKTPKIMKNAHRVKVKVLTCSLYQHTFPCALD